MTELERTANYLRELARRYTAQGLVYAVALAIAQPEAPLTDCRLSDHLFAWRTVRRLCDLDCQDSPVPPASLPSGGERLPLTLAEAHDAALARAATDAPATRAVRIQPRVVHTIELPADVPLAPDALTNYFNDHGGFPNVLYRGEWQPLEPADILPDAKAD